MCPQVSRFVIYLSELTSVMHYACVCVRENVCERVHLFIQSLVVFKERLQSFEDLHLAGDSRWWGCLSFHHCHSQTTFVTRHQTLQVLQQQLQHEQTHTNVCMTKENTNSRNIVCFHQRQTRTPSKTHTHRHTYPGVVPFCFQLRYFLLFLQQLLTAYVQLLCEGGKLLHNKYTHNTHTEVNTVSLIEVMAECVCLTEHESSCSLVVKECMHVAELFGGQTEAQTRGTHYQQGMSGHT